MSGRVGDVEPSDLQREFFAGSEHFISDARHSTARWKATSAIATRLLRDISYDSRELPVQLSPATR